MMKEDEKEAIGHDIEDAGHSSGPWSTEVESRLTVPLLQVAISI
jgi:hypothetical protein